MRLSPRIVAAVACFLVLLLGTLGIEGFFRASPKPPAKRASTAAHVPVSRRTRVAEPPSATIPTRVQPERQVQETADPITALAALTDFQKLATLSTAARAANPRVKKILYWLYVAEEKGIEPAAALDQAFSRNGNAASPRAPGAKAQTLTNFNQAKIWGMFTPESLERLKRGDAAPIVRGTWAGQSIEIDHIVPLSRYPQFGNELANLQLLPAKQNRSKSDRMGGVEFEKLQELQRLPALGRSRSQTSPAALNVPVPVE
jgi:hypothetical protein